ncbi:MAG: type IV toxin-antitoxin system AbiEi family antitoxin domain-containing protein, partial [Mycobacteriales bacterium]
MPREPTAARLARIAQEQWGLLTRRQAAAAGISPATLARLASDGSIIERVAHGVYHLLGAPVPDHLDLRAAWLQLAPEIPAWQRTADQGVVSHRSAATLYGIGALPADRHEFTLPMRRQTRRPDVRLYVRDRLSLSWISLRGIPVTAPARIAADLLRDHEDPEAVGQIVVEATRQVYDYPATFAAAIAPFAARFGLANGDGLGLLRWLYELVGDPDIPRWMDEASGEGPSDGESE